MDLQRRMYHESRQAIGQALSYYVADDLDASVIFSAMGVEFLAKSVLAQTNPALVADLRHKRSVLWFANPVNDGQAPPAFVRSVKFSEAKELLSDLVPGWNKTMAAELFDHRNRCAHLGGGLEGHHALEAIMSALVAIEQMLPTTGWTGKNFYGEHSQLALDLLDQRKSAIEARVRSLFEAAAARAPSLSPKDIQSLANAVRTQLEVQRDAPHDQIVDCPVCGLPALVVGELVLTRWEPTYESKGIEERAEGHFEGHDFRCATCGLNLNGSEAIHSSGVLENWELSEVDREAWEELERASDEYIAIWG